MGTGICLKCNVNLHYVYDSANKICLAQPGYYLDVSYVPKLCYTAITGCTDCTNATVCLACDTIKYYILFNQSCAAAPGYYLNASSFPIACPQTGCS